MPITIKNISKSVEYMKPISMDAVMDLRNATQHFSDCYLVSSISALTRCENGRKILQNNIKRAGDSFCIRFNNVNGKTEEYIVTKSDCEKMVFTDEYCNPVEVKHHPIIHALEVAVDKLLKNHPDKKAFAAKFLNFIRFGALERFEYNRPSTFLEMFTGIKPITLNENNFQMSLKRHEKEALNLLEAIGKKEDSSSFVFGTGVKWLSKTFSDFHCYEVISTDNLNKNVIITEHREHKRIPLSYEKVIKDIKYICGYFNSMLAPKSEVLK